MFKAIKIQQGTDNFFTPLRVLMAMAVLIGHAFVVRHGGTEFEPKIFLHYTPSYTAVNIFFILSGFLVTKSMFYRADLASYSSARILRIFPALLAHILIVTFVIGAAMTTLPLGQYLTHPDTLKQVPLVLSFINTDVFLPGVFDGNPEKYGSAALWTLRYEVLAYIGTAALFTVGLLRKPWMIIATFLVCCAAWSTGYRSGLAEQLPATLEMFLRFGLAYSLGAAIYAVEKHIRFYALLIPIPFITAYLMAPMIETEIIFNLGLAYVLFTLGYAKLPLLDPLKKMTDISYGVYIWHWVVLQVIRAKFPEANLWQLAVPTLIISSTVAWLSWHFIEEPALHSKDKLAAWLSCRHKATPAAPQHPAE